MSFIEKISLPDSITAIGEGAFIFCLVLENLDLLAGISKIGKYAFFECESLQRIVIPPNVKSIGEHTFFYCLSLREVVIPEGVTEIGDYAFCNCQRLRNVTIPASVNAIGYRALGWYESISWAFGFTINGYTGSTAETYARENEIRFTSLGTLIPGNFNGDNSVDLKDVELLRRCIAGGWNVTLQ